MEFKFNTYIYTPADLALLLQIANINTEKLERLENEQFEALKTKLYIDETLLDIEKLGAFINSDELETYLYDEFLLPLSFDVVKLLNCRYKTIETNILNDGYLTIVLADNQYEALKQHYSSDDIVKFKTLENHTIEYLFDDENWYINETTFDETFDVDYSGTITEKEPECKNIGEYDDDDTQDVLEEFYYCLQNEIDDLKDNDIRKPVMNLLVQVGILQAVLNKKLTENEEKTWELIESKTLLLDSIMNETYKTLDKGTFIALLNNLFECVENKTSDMLKAMELIPCIFDYMKAS